MSARKEDGQVNPEIYTVVVVSNLDDHAVIGSPIQENKIQNAIEEPVFSVEHYDTPEEGQYFVAGWQTHVTQDDFFSQVDTLHTSLESAGVPPMRHPNYEYNWEIETAEDVNYRQPWRSSSKSLAFLKSTIPGVDTGCIRLETRYGDFFHFTYIDREGITMHAGMKSTISSPEIVTKFVKQSLPDKVPEQMIQSLFNKPTLPIKK